VHYEALTAGTPRGIDGVRVQPFAVPHTKDLVALGYRIEVDGKTIVYSGDSAWTEDFVAQSRGADLFLCECSTYETRLDIHISYPEIAARARDLGCRRLVLSHLGSEPLAHLAELNLECARDGMTLDL
jgi:ribonuclease BN (tRNA processing enzyme)